MEPDDEVADDMLAHSRSAEATGTIILSPGGKSIYYHHDPEPGGWIEDICRIDAGNGKFLKIVTDTNNPSGIRAELTRYLGELRKELIAFIYRRDGETGRLLRELTVQTLINQVLLTRMRNTHQMRLDPVHEQTLYGHLFSYVAWSPALGRYDIRMPDSDPAETRSNVHQLASASSPSLSGIRLSWIEPGTWAAVFRDHLASIPKKHDRRAVAPRYEEDIDPGSVLDTRMGGFITGILAGNVSRKDTGPVYDPSPGCGEFIAHILKMYRIKKTASGGTDTIVSRLIMASDLVTASDPSPVHISIIRFIITISIIDGAFRDPQLSGPLLWYPVRALTDHVRTGNILFSADISDEFYSEAAGYQALCRLHPLDPGELGPPEGGWSLVLSYPPGAETGGSPETGSYLAGRYQSYQAGIHPAALLVERLYDHLARDGTCIMVLPSSWLSEDQFRGFRRWISLHLPAMIITQEEDSGLSGITNISVIVIQNKGEPVLNVVRLQDVPGRKISGHGVFSVSRDHLPDSDGWNLADPWEEKFLKQFGSDLVPLSGYLFDEIYQAESVSKTSGSSEGWMSVFLTRNGLVIHQGERPDPAASAIIPGKDPYIMGLLGSSLTTMYLRTIAGRTDSDCSDLSTVKKIPIRTIDEYCSDELRLRDTIIQSVQRIAMLRRLTGESRPWHDRERINRQIAESEQNLDLAVCSLYGLSPDDCDEIRRRALLDLASDRITQR